DEFFNGLQNDILALQTSTAEAANLKTRALSEFEASTSAEQAEKLATEVLTQALTAHFDKITGLISNMQSLLEAAQATNRASGWRQENKTNFDEYARIVAELKSQGISNAEDASQAVALEEKLKADLDHF